MKQNLSDKVEAPKRATRESLFSRPDTDFVSKQTRG